MKKRLKRSYVQEIQNGSQFPSSTQLQNLRFHVWLLRALVFYDAHFVVRGGVYFRRVFGLYLYFALRRDQMTVVLKTLGFRGNRDTFPPKSFYCLRSHCQIFRVIFRFSENRLSHFSSIVEERKKKKEYEKKRIFLYIT